MALGRIPHITYAALWKLLAFSYVSTLFPSSKAVTTKLKSINKVIRLSLPHSTSFYGFLWAYVSSLSLQEKQRLQYNFLYLFKLGDFYFSWKIVFSRGLALSISRLNVFLFYQHCNSHSLFGLPPPPPPLTSAFKKRNCWGRQIIWSSYLQFRLSLSRKPKLISWS